MSSENQWQYCKKCGRDMRFEFFIRNAIWKMLPTKWHNHVLCIECFLEELENTSFRHHFSLEDFGFLGIIGKSFDGILVDEFP